MNRSQRIDRSWSRSQGLGHHPFMFLMNISHQEFKNLWQADHNWDFNQDMIIIMRATLLRQLMRFYVEKSRISAMTLQSVMALTISLKSTLKMDQRSMTSQRTSMKC